MSDPGTMEILLDGKPVELRASLQAARMVNGMAGGFVGAYNLIRAYDMNAFATIIAAGMGKKLASEVGEVEEIVFRTGMAPLNEPVTKFVDMLVNGGRPKEDAGAPKGKQAASS